MLVSMITCLLFRWAESDSGQIFSMETQETGTIPSNSRLTSKCLYLMWSCVCCASACSDIFGDNASILTAIKHWHTPKHLYKLLLYAELWGSTQLSEAAERANVIMKGWMKCLYTAGANEWGQPTTKQRGLFNNPRPVFKSFSLLSEDRFQSTMQSENNLRETSRANDGLLSGSVSVNESLLVIENHVYNRPDQGSCSGNDRFFFLLLFLLE